MAWDLLTFPYVGGSEIGIQRKKKLEESGIHPNNEVDWTAESHVEVPLENKLARVKRK